MRALSRNPSRSPSPSPSPSPSRRTSHDDKDKVKVPTGAFVGDRFIVERELGVGGYAVVYGAKDTKTERRVALKCYSHDPRLEHIADVEAQNMKRAGTHQNLASRVLSRFEFEINSIKVNATVLPIAAGSLYDYLCSQGAADYTDANAVAVQLASGLHHLHTRYLAHGDLKPENILVYRAAPGVRSRGWEVRIADFDGIVDVSPGAPRRPDSVHITHQYSAPEYVLRGDYFAKSDMWALACVYFETLTASVLFDADDESDDESDDECEGESDDGSDDDGSDGGESEKDECGGSESCGSYEVELRECDVMLMKEIIDVLGPLPDGMFTPGLEFDHRGQVRNVPRIPDPLDRLLRKAGVSTFVSHAASEFCLKFLKYDHQSRCSAEEAASHEFPGFFGSPASL